MGARQLRVRMVSPVLRLVEHGNRLLRSLPLKPLARAFVALVIPRIRRMRFLLGGDNRLAHARTRRSVNENAVPVIDPKPPERVRDPDLLRRLHLAWDECMICGASMGLMLHHISNHPRDDLEANLVMLCGSGTTGCHGLVTGNDAVALRKLATYLWLERSDTLDYLNWRFPIESAEHWLLRVHGLESW